MGHCRLWSHTQICCPLYPKNWIWTKCGCRNDESHRGYRLCAIITCNRLWYVWSNFYLMFLEKKIVVPEKSFGILKNFFWKFDEVIPFLKNFKLCWWWIRIIFYEFLKFHFSDLPFYLADYLGKLWVINIFLIWTPVRCQLANLGLATKLFFRSKNICFRTNFLF